MFNLGYGIKTKLEGTGFMQFILNVETGIISLSKTGGFLKITNASNNQMHVIRQGIFQIKHLTISAVLILILASLMI